MLSSDYITRLYRAVSRIQAMMSDEVEDGHTGLPGNVFHLG